MFKTNILNLVLAALVALTALFSMAMCYRYTRSLGHLQRLQSYTQELRGYVARAERDRRIADAMANDALEYSKRNPSIDPLLQRFDIKPKAAAPAAPPAQKPGAR